MTGLLTFFSTRTLLQIITVLSATLAMKYMATPDGVNWIDLLAR